MTLPSGKTLSALAVALMLAAGGAALRIGLSADLRGAARSGTAPGEGERAARGWLLGARDAERRGDVAEAVAGYRKAAEIRPELVDRRSPDYLGPEFERNLRGWISALRSGRAAGGRRALEDASAIFRRMYGGCG